MFTGRACLPGFPEVRGDRLLFAYRVKSSSARRTCRCCQCCRTVASAHGISTRTMTEFRTCSSYTTCSRGIQQNCQRCTSKTQALVKAAYIDEAGSRVWSRKFASFRLVACGFWVWGLGVQRFLGQCGFLGSGFRGSRLLGLFRSIKHSAEPKMLKPNSTPTTRQQQQADAVRKASSKAFRTAAPQSSEAQSPNPKCPN